MAATSNTVFAHLIRDDDGKDGLGGGVEFLGCGTVKRGRKKEMRAPQRDGRTDEPHVQCACVRACVRHGSNFQEAVRDGSEEKEEVSSSLCLSLSPSHYLTPSRWPLGLLPNAMMKGMRTHAATAGLGSGMTRCRAAR